MPITHNFVSAITDDPAAEAAGEVLPSHWNAEHDVSIDTADIVDGAVTAAKTDAGVQASLALADSALQGPAGSNTQVQFNDGGALGADADFVWDKTNNRLGVGTSSPQQELEVVGTFRSQAKGPSDNIFFEGYNSAGLQVGVMAEASSGGFGGMSMQGYRPPNSGGAGFFFNGISGGNNTQAVTFQASGGTIGNLSAWNGTAPAFLYSVRTGPTTANNIVEIMGSGETRFNILSASAKGIIVKGAASQTANLQEWQNSSGTVLGGVDAKGRMFVGAAPAAADVSANYGPYALTINAPASPTNNPGREGFLKITVSDADAATNYFALTNNNSTDAAFNPFFIATSTGQYGSLGFVYDSSGSWVSDPLDIAGVNFQIRNGAGIETSTNRPAFRFSNYDVMLTAISVDGEWTYRPRTAATRAIVVKGAASQTANLTEWQNSSGTVLTSVSAAGKITTGDDVEITDSTKGVILKSPNGTRWRVTVDNSGNLTTTSL